MNQFHIFEGSQLLLNRVFRVILLKTALKKDVKEEIFWEVESFVVKVELSRVYDLNSVIKVILTDSVIEEIKVQP